MKQVNILTMLLVSLVSINSYIYIDYLSVLIEKTASYTGMSAELFQVTLSDLYIISLIIFICNLIPILVLNILLLKIKYSKLLMPLILIIYTVSWFFTSYILVLEYIQLLGHTWLKMEVFIFTLQLDNIYLSYFLSLIPILILIYINNKSIDK